MSILGLFKKIADCLKIHYTTFSKMVSKKRWGIRTDFSRLDPKHQALSHKQQ